MNAELLAFTRDALAKNVGRGEIASALEKAGWMKADIKAALDAFADVPFSVPVPRPKPYLSAQEVFIYLVMFSALYATAYDVGALVFAFINHLIPDPLQAASYSFFDAVRWNLSSLVVTFPVFFLTFRSINKKIAADPVRRSSKPRKWLTYITLYVAAFSLVADLTGLVYNALGGELTSRFLLKVLTVAILAGGIFLYFLWDVRQEASS
ncbi:MAG: DUF5671 domain-containing protein [Alphaproteobacteria bacterium]